MWTGIGDAVAAAFTFATQLTSLDAKRVRVLDHLLKHIQHVIEKKNELLEIEYPSEFDRHRLGELLTQLDELHKEIARVTKLYKR